MQIEITDRIEHFIEEYQKYQENKKVCEYIQDRIDFGSDYWYELEEKIKDDRHWMEMYAGAIADAVSKEYEYSRKAIKYMFNSAKKEAEADE